MDLERLEDEYTNFLLSLCDRTHRETVKYNPTRFRRMVNDHGGAEATRRILWIDKDKPGSGLVRLWELGRLDLSVEAKLYEGKKWHPLFEEKDIERCREILEQHDYFK